MTKVSMSWVFLGAAQWYPSCSEIQQPVCSCWTNEHGPGGTGTQWHEAAPRRNQAVDQWGLWYKSMLPSPALGSWDCSSSGDICHLSPHLNFLAETLVTLRQCMACNLFGRASGSVFELNCFMSWWWMRGAWENPSWEHCPFCCSLSGH